MDEQEAKDKMVSNLGTDFLRNAKELGWNARIDYRRIKPGERERIIDGEEFVGWHIGSQSLRAYDGSDNLISAVGVSDPQCKLISCAPALFRAVIEFVNHWRSFDHLTVELEAWIERYEKIIVDAGFGCDIGVED